MGGETPQDADYRFVAVRRPGYVYASVTGENTVANVRRILGDVLAACAEHACSRVLLEEHLTGPSLGTIDAFELVSEGSQTARAAVQQIAYVDTNPEHDSALHEFIETVAVNRGVRIRVFPTVAQAAAWLDSLPPR